MKNTRGTGRRAWLALPLLASIAMACSTNEHALAGQKSEKGERSEGAEKADTAASLLTDTASGGVSEADIAALEAVPRVPFRDSCPAPNGAPRPGTVRCFAKLRTDEAGQRLAYAAPRGLGAQDLSEAYHVPSSGTRTGTIAIVDAYDNPNAEADLDVYRKQYGLPPCTTANGCFKKVNQNGAPSPLPAPDVGWGGEIALDLDVASAMCPACNLLLVEGDAPTLRDLGMAVNTAVRMGAAVVSNSYGGPELGDDSEGGVGSIEEADALYYSNHPGVGIFAASGDNAFEEGTSYPASGVNVIGIGGTRLVRSSTNPRGWVEGAWSRAGSGCSTHIAKPKWANDGPDCAKKTVADISAVGDPATGAAVYNSYGVPSGGSGWAIVGGTSAATPIVAAIFVLTGKAGYNGSFIWQNPKLFYDVTTGNNASRWFDAGLVCPRGSYLCNARVGFDGPTGWGSPNTALLLEAGGVGGSDGGGAAGLDAGAGKADAGVKKDAPTLADASTGTKNDSDPESKIAPAAKSESSGCSCVVVGKGKNAIPLSVVVAMIAMLVAARRRRSDRPI
ncbi:S8 family serine peptidase [Pendulispora albinea]|uniref:S8 family serine peptidase n=1 Tax=Pendulispora albinea TaxID=2741071 RepID=A0ABZ2LJD9_9BACT